MNTSHIFSSIIYPEYETQTNYPFIKFIRRYIFFALIKFKSVKSAPKSQFAVFYRHLRQLIHSMMPSFFFLYLHISIPVNLNNKLRRILITGYFSKKKKLFHNLRPHTNKTVRIKFWDLPLGLLKSRELLHLFFLDFYAYLTNSRSSRSHLYICKNKKLKKK